MLQDPITRVAKDPIRKLGHDDRIVGAAELCLSQDVPPDHIATVCAAALCYDHPEDAGAARLQSMIENTGVAEVLRQISRVEPGGGFGQRVIAQYQNLRRTRAT
jgi:mannitol-1-phosphate 5-dehydrogenase